MEASLQLPYDLNDVLKTEEVKVVQSLDVGKLRATLEWLVSAINKQAGARPDSQQIQAQIDALKDQQKVISGEVQGIKSHQVSSDLLDLALLHV